MKRVFAGLLLSFIAVTGVYAQSFSRIYNRDLPIKYFDLWNMEPLSAYRLFENDNFNSRETVRGTMTVICESTSEENGIFTGTLLVSLDEEKWLYISISLQSDTENEYNYITAIKSTDIVKDETETIRYDGTLQSGGEMIGAMVELIHLLYDQGRLFAP